MASLTVFCQVLTKFGADKARSSEDDDSHDEAFLGGGLVPDAPNGGAAEELIPNQKNFLAGCRLRS